MSDSVGGKDHLALPSKASDKVSQISNDSSNISATSVSFVSPPLATTTSMSSTSQDDQSSRGSWSGKSMGAIGGLVGTLRTNIGNSFHRLSLIGDSSKRGIPFFLALISHYSTHF